MKLKSIYSNLNSWQKTQVARHEDRPRANFYISKKYLKTLLLYLEIDILVMIIL